jgi:serine/threonine-protein kinase
MVNGTDPRRRYKVISTLGKGGFGTVYRAEMIGHGGFSKQVALKVLNETDDESLEEIALRFRDEARILGLIDHRAVVKVDSLAQLEQGWAVVMEYVHGVNVTSMVKAPTPPRVALQVVEEVASALHAAYAMPSRSTGEPLRLIHRDIKPANIRVTPQGTVKVLDFGVARADFRGREAMTTQMRFGSLRYMAPERIDDIDTHAGDIFALGLILAELLGARRYPEPPKSEGRYEAFHNGVGELVRHNLGGGGFPVEDAELLEEMVALVLQCIAYDHEARPTAKELEQACRRLARSVPGPELRDWAEATVPGLIEANPVDQVATDSILMESTGALMRRKSGGLDTTNTIAVSNPWTLMQLGLVVGSAMLVLGLVLLGVLLFGGLGTGIDASTPETPDPDGVVDVDDGQTDGSATDPGPTPAEGVEPEPDVQPEPDVLPESDVLPEPEPAPESVAQPAPVAPAPAPVRPAPRPQPTPPPEPAPEPAASGATVRLQGDATSVELRQGGETLVLSGSTTVPAGTWAVHATFEGTDPMVAATLTFAEGESATIRCQSMLLICSKR